MLTYTLKKEKGRSLYDALYHKIRADITGGLLPAGARLPSKRALAGNLGVSVATVESAYAQLLAEGYIASRERSGHFVCAIGERKRPAPPIAPQESRGSAPALLDLSGGGEDVPFPFSVWAKTMRSVLSEQTHELLRPVELCGVPTLRQAIAQHLYQSRAMQVAPEQILIGAGNEYLYGLIVQLLGRDIRYGVEDPGYRKISGIYAANDVAICHIPMDSDGLCVDDLRQSGAQIAHISPAHHYPTGNVMPIRRRNELLHWAHEAQGRYILEDDYDSELRHSGKPVPPLFSLDMGQRVIYLSTFSQTIAPSLRIAYLCLPRDLMRRMQEKLGFYACTVPSFEQYTLARFISGGAYEKHVNRLRKRYRDRRAEIFAVLEASPLRGKYSIREENAGTHFLLLLRTEKTDAALKKAAAQRGLAVKFLSDYRADGQDSGGCMILNYACLPKEQATRAMELLAQIL
ncbi:MAG: PLP-dependent aminotransferase family protein [Oscillospiraceae bacterium]|jgi:GntR family transcriptional regulator/MocR family aminotransferase|nr:PLP-dependent aminotransferase family protein [Oscillospiraceae bacterium]